MPGESVICMEKTPPEGGACLCIAPSCVDGQCCPAFKARALAGSPDRGEEIGGGGGPMCQRGPAPRRPGRSRVRGPSARASPASAWCAPDRPSIESRYCGGFVHSWEEVAQRLSDFGRVRATPRTRPIKAQSTTMARAMAHICNAARVCSGACGTRLPRVDSGGSGRGIGIEIRLTSTLQIGPNQPIVT